MHAESLCNKKTISNKTQLTYFRDYFNYLDASTIVVERNYIDRDYLEDYSAYYVRCFRNYRRYCSRLHFFKSKFNEDDLKNLLNGNQSKLTDETLNDEYLGFIVIKPLPETIIGRTCLKIYNDDDDRKYPITRKYKANLFGIDLTVDKTIAFQEQDSVVSACATSALWSAFQGTGILFQHKIPSPVEITKVSDGIYSSDESRTFPNTKLKPTMMAKAIRSVGLEPYSRSIINNHDELIIHLFAYLKCGIPVILGMILYDTTKNSDEKGYRKDAKHAVAVTGFKLEKEEPIKNLYGLKFTASRISKIYVHDDQVGPFVRMGVSDKKVVITDHEGGIINATAFTTSHPDGNRDLTNIKAIPDLIMLPLYHKIRIPYKLVEEAINFFGVILNTLIQQLPENTQISLSDKYEWDIYLTTVNSFKADLFENRKLNDFSKNLTSGLPHYIWRASACINNKTEIDFLFDATDIEQGSFFLPPIFYKDILKQELIDLFNNSDLKSAIGEDVLEDLEKTQGWHIVQWFKQDNA